MKEYTDADRAMTDIFLQNAQEAIRNPSWYVLVGRRYHHRQFIFNGLGEDMPLETEAEVRTRVELQGGPFFDD